MRKKKSKKLSAQGKSKLESKLLIYVEEGNLDKTKQLISSGVDSNCKKKEKETSAPDKSHQTPLIIAINYNHIEIVHYLIAIKKCDINLADDIGRTPLYYAVKCSLLEIVLVLIKQGANIYKSNSLGWTPLHLAIRNNNIPITKAIIKKGNADPLREELNGRNALMHAALYGHNDIINYFLEIGVPINRVNNEYKSALFYAALFNKPDTVRLLIDMGADPNINDKKGFTPLRIAKLWQHEKVVTILSNVTRKNKKVFYKK